MNYLRIFVLFAIITAAVAFAGVARAADRNDKAKPPNIVYIMLDELGYFELSCMGNKYLKTPNIDRMAAEGMRFTNAMAGGSVCAPTRSTLMTGQHLGHTTVRQNGGGEALRAGDVTIAQVLKKAGYATGGFGKWGLGDNGTTGVPERHGFDVFFGYYHQVHAHSFYPVYLLRNGEKVYLEGNTGDAYKGKTFSHYLIYEETVKFIRENKDGPFFCYCPWTPPHGLWGFPKTDPSWELYKDKPWTVGQRTKDDGKVYAAMVNMVDREIGEIFALLKKLGIDEETIVFFSGDNGGQPYFKDAEHPNGLFCPNGGKFRGGKGSLYSGGYRIPMIVRWPGKIKAGTVSDLLWYFPDVMPTLAELAGTEPPEDIDGISIVPTLLGEKAAGRKQKQHKYFYWEGRGSAAVQMGDWRAVFWNLLADGGKKQKGKKKGKQPRFELYDLSKDIGEEHDVAAEHPEILEKMVTFAKEAHTPNVKGTYVEGGREKGFKGHTAK